MAEYSYPLVQTVSEDENIIFLDGDRACRKGYITHRSGAGLFRLKGATNGSIILLHDLYESSVDAFIIAYDKLIAEGYKFVTISEMLGLTGKDCSGYAFYSSYTAYYLDKRCS